MLLEFPVENFRWLESSEGEVCSLAPPGSDLVQLHSRTKARGSEK